MTKEQALKDAKKIANKEKIEMVVFEDSISNNIEDEPEGPWAYCPNQARGENGKIIIGRWATEEIIVKPGL